MSERAGGYYWIRGCDGHRYIVEWDGTSWWAPRCEKPVTVPEADIVAGPVKRPERRGYRVERVAMRLHDTHMYSSLGLPDVPYVAVGAEVRYALRKMAERAIEAVDGADGDLASGPPWGPSAAPIISGITGQPIDDPDGALRKRLDEIDKGEDVGSRRLRVLALGEEFEREARLPDGISQQSTSAMSNVDLTIRGIKCDARPGIAAYATLDALRSRARQLLEGTKSDLEYVSDVHALLTELASEGGAPAHVDRSDHLRGWYAGLKQARDLADNYELLSGRADLGGLKAAIDMLLPESERQNNRAPATTVATGGPCDGEDGR